MSTIRQLLAALSVALLLTACGGGNKDISGGGTGSGGTDTTDSATLAISSLVCTDAASGTGCTDTLDLPAEKSNRIEVVLKDSNGKAIANTSVTLASSKGSVSPDAALTDSKGVAVFTLKAPAVNTSGAGTLTATYTASSSTVTKTLDFSFIPSPDSGENNIIKITTLSCVDAVNNSGCSDTVRLPAEKTNRVEVSLTDSSGSPITNAKMALTSDLGTLSSPSVLTDSTGLAVFLLKAPTSTNSGAGTLSASYTNSNNITVTKSLDFSFIPSSDSGTGIDSPTLTISSFACSDVTSTTTCTETLALPAATPNRIEVLLKDAQNKAITNTSISLSSTSGTVTPDKVLTDSNGVAVFTLTAPAVTTSGAATLTATYTANSTTVTKTLDFTFVPNPDSGVNNVLKITTLSCVDAANLSHPLI